MRQRAHPRTLNARLPQGLGEARALASDEPGVGATFSAGREAQDRGSHPGALRLPPRAAGGHGAWAQGQERSITRTHQVQGTGPCRGPMGAARRLEHR